jgi:hypothetical protein
MQPTTTQTRSTFWRPMRLAALFGFFSLFAIPPNGDPAFLLFLMFFLFFLPFPEEPRTKP